MGWYTKSPDFGTLELKRKSQSLGLKHFRAHWPMGSPPAGVTISFQFVSRLVYPLRPKRPRLVRLYEASKAAKPCGWRDSNSPGTIPFLRRVEKNLGLPVGWKVYIVRSSRGDSLGGAGHANWRASEESGGPLKSGTLLLNLLTGRQKQVW